LNTTQGLKRVYGESQEVPGVRMDTLETGNGQPERSRKLSVLAVPTWIVQFPYLPVASR
jgi:hypothetical protein